MALLSPKGRKGSERRNSYPHDVDESSAKSKITQFDVGVLIKNHVFRLEIAVVDAIGV